MIMKKCHLFQPTVNIFVNPGSSFPAKFPTCLFCAAGSVCRNRFQQREDPGSPALSAAGPYRHRRRQLISVFAAY
jgi:hypothetical protein